MKRITTFILGLFLSANLYAGTIESNETIDEIHQVFVTKTKKIDFKNATKELVFFGTVEELKKEYNDIQNSIKEKGLDVTLTALKSSSSAIAKGFYEAAGKGLLRGAGIGVIYGLLDPYVMSLHKPDTKEIYLTYNYTDVKGNKSRVNGVFLAPDFDDKKIIKKYLDEKIEGVLK